jgi:hypothetical protein
MLDVTAMFDEADKLDELYRVLSATVSATVTAHEIESPSYFEELRTVIRRVVTETTESGLSEEEKREIIDRLMAHVSSLEEWWVKLKPT